MHINPPCNQTSRCLWWLGLISNNRKNIFTEPPYEVGKSRLISISGQTASFFPPYSLWSLGGHSTELVDVFPLLCWLRSMEHTRRVARKRGQVRPGYLPLLVGWSLDSNVLPGKRSNLGSPLHRAPSCQVLVTPSCSALQAKLGHSSAPRTGYCPTCMLPLQQGSMSQILHKTYFVW